MELTAQHLIGGEPSLASQAEPFVATDPETGAALAPTYHDASDEEIDRALQLAAAAAPALAAALLEEEQAEDRGYFAEALAALRTEAAIPALVQALADPDSQVRSAASAGLRALPKLAGPALREALVGEDPLLRERAQELLRELER